MSAIDRLRVLIWLETAALEKRGIGEAYGDDWFELTEEEARIFGLNLADLPSLVAVWTAFETVLGIADSLPHASAALVEDVRAELPWLAGSIEWRALECYEFQRFAALFGVSYRKAHAWHAKCDFHDIRSGIVFYDDEDSRPGGDRIVFNTPRPA